MKLRNLFMMFAISALLLMSCDRPKAELEFYETCSYEEINDRIYKPLQDLNKELRSEGKAPLNSLSYMNTASLVGYSHPDDTAAINGLIELAYSKGILNRDEVLFMWLHNNELPELYALKPAVAMEGDILKKAEATHGFSGNPSIYVTFTSDAAKAFADLSEKNIGQGIAVVINGRLLSVPFVMCRIDGGKVEISGNFTEEEAEQFAEALAPGWRSFLPF